MAGAWVRPPLPHWEHALRQQRIHHAAKVYGRGDVHTNSIDGFWSLVKRGIGDVCHAVSEKYLQAYPDEYSFRYNGRRSEMPMFVAILRRLARLRMDSPIHHLFESPAS